MLGVTMVGMDAAKKTTKPRLTREFVAGRGRL
jgi:hypothetical protein